MRQGTWTLLEAVRLPRRARAAFRMSAHTGQSTSTLGARPNARDLQPNPKQMGARGNVKRLAVGITERKVCAYNSRSGFGCDIWQFQRAESLGRGNPNLVPHDRIYIAFQIHFNAVVAAVQ